MLDQARAVRPSAASLTASTRLLVLFAVLAIPTLALPWFVPVRPSRSMSYLQGFSNATLWLLLVFVLIAPAWWLLRSRLAPGFTPAAARGGAPGPDALMRLHSWSFASWLVFAVFLLACSYNLAGYMDGEYFLMRVDLLAAGKLPYRDFEYAYGPALLYAPLALQHIGIPPGPALAVLDLLQSAAGYFAVNAIARWVLPAPAAAWMFRCILLATAPGLLMGGENYTFLRFAGVAALAYWLLQRFGRSRALAVAWLTGPVFILAWSISPEIAIAVGAAYTIMLAVVCGRPVLVALAAGLSLAGCIAATPLVLESYGTLFEFGAGGNNFPAYPSVHILFFTLSIFLATAQVATKPIRRAPADWFLFIYSVALIPGAFGRCDPLHVIYYGFGFVILAARYCLDHDLVRSAFTKFSLAYVAIFLVTWIPLYAYYGVPKMGLIIARTAVAGASQLRTVLGHVPGTDAEFWHNAAALAKADSWEVGQIERRPGELYIIKPRSDMPQAARFVTYFVGLENATSAGAYRLISQQIRGKRVLVRPEAFPSMCSPWMTEFGSVLFIFPTGIFPIRHDGKEVAREFCAQLDAAHYVGMRGPFMELAIPADMPARDGASD